MLYAHTLVMGSLTVCDWLAELAISVDDRLGSLVGVDCNL